MLKPLSQDEVSRIVKNVLDACIDIKTLSQQGYQWISLRAGFIAHYNREGFIADFENSQNLRENILAYEHHNTRFNRSQKDIDYPFYKQVSEMYLQIVEQLKANPAQYRQKKHSDDFVIEFSWLPTDNIHQIKLCTKRGSVGVFADKQYLLSLANNIHAHLQEADLFKSKQP
jgi:hypothetical protein